MGTSLSSYDGRKGVSKPNRPSNHGILESENASVFLGVPRERYLSSGK